MRLPNPSLYFSPERPTCPGIVRGQAVSERDRSLLLCLHHQGYSATQISRLPYVGRSARTVELTSRPKSTPVALRKRVQVRGLMGAAGYGTGVLPISV
jgi:hypothetical protein